MILKKNNESIKKPRGMISKPIQNVGFDWTVDGFQNPLIVGETYAFKISWIDEDTTNQRITFSVQVNRDPYDLTIPSFLDNAMIFPVEFMMFVGQPSGMKVVRAIGAGVRRVTKLSRPTGDDFQGLICIGEYTENTSKSTGVVYPSFKNIQVITKGNVYKPQANADQSMGQGDNTNGLKSLGKKGKEDKLFDSSILDEVDDI